MNKLLADIFNIETTNVFSHMDESHRPLSQTLKETGYKRTHKWNDPTYLKF